jgi:hypothetical protein
MKAIKWTITILIVAVPSILYYWWMVVIFPHPTGGNIVIGSVWGCILFYYWMEKAERFGKWFDSKLKPND